MNKDSISKDLKLFSQYSCIFVTNSSSGIELKTKVLITDAHQAKYNNSILGLCREVERAEPGERGQVTGQWVGRDTLIL